MAESQSTTHRDDLAVTRTQVDRLAGQLRRVVFLRRQLAAAERELARVRAEVEAS